MSLNIQDFYIFLNYLKVNKLKYYFNRLSKKFIYKHNCENSITIYMVSHLVIYEISQEGKIIVKPNSRFLEIQIKDTFIRL